jgi:23S rRNA (uracil1939-C5)-methyltransferase
VLRLDPTQHVYDGVLLDPPRAGAPGVLEKVLRQRPLRVVYISCNPLSLVRDLRTVKGYRLHSAHCFDMFPKTHHVETVVTLERSHPRDSVLPMR